RLEVGFTKPGRVTGRSPAERDERWLEVTKECLKMKISMRGGLATGLVMVMLLAAAQFASHLNAADEAEAAARKEGQLDVKALGNMIEAMGVDAKLDDKRYDFNFKTVYGGEEWELSMSAVLSQNEKSLWVMAWLDELPKSAADVPRTALLRLLANNDRMGNGKFFAYIPSNRRFVLQRVVSNEDMTTATFRELLQDLGASVVETFPHWTVSNWKASETAAKPSDEAIPSNEAKSAPAHPLTETRKAPSRSAGKAARTKSNATE
ncbi:MAG: type III secretion system chaperone, partial [Planctomycetaceae bacterium]